MAAEINLLITVITVLFFLLLGVKSLISNKKIKSNFCVICGSVSLTWIIFLVLYWMDLFTNILIISLLMGMSITGIYYSLQDKIKTNKKLMVFRLPFMLTLIIIGYSLLNLEIVVKSFFVVLSVWLLFTLVYLYKNTKFTKKLLECCKQ